MSTYRPEDVNKTAFVPFEHDGELYAGELVRIKNHGWKKRRIYRDDDVDPNDERCDRVDMSDRVLWNDDMPSLRELLEKAGVAEPSQRRRT